MFQADNFTSLSSLSSSSRNLAPGRPLDIGHGLPSFDLKELHTGDSIWGDGPTEVTCNAYQLDSGYQTTGLGSSMPQSTFISRRPSRDTSPLGRRTLPQMPAAANADMMATSTKETFKNVPMTNEMPIPWPRRSLPPPENPSATPTRLRMQIKEEVDVVMGPPNEVLLLMRRLWEQEVIRARQWLQDMSWSTHAEYHSTQDQIAVMEEQFRRSFNVEPPQGDFISKESYDEIICADTLLSMVDNAWAIIEEEEEEDSQGDVTLKRCSESQPPSANVSLNLTTAPSPSLPRTVNTSYAGKVKRSLSVMGPSVSPLTRSFPPRSTAQPIPLLPAEQISRMTSCPDPVVGSTALHRRSSLPAGPKMNTRTPTEDTNFTSSLPNKFVAGGSGGSSSASSTSMQVHKRSMKPRKQDAFFNIRYKTQECVHFKRGDPCPAGENCHFAHGFDELRTPRHHPKFKTQECKHFAKTGHCPYGKACFFLHSTTTPTAANKGDDNCNSNKNGGNQRHFK